MAFLGIMEWFPYLIAVVAVATMIAAWFLLRLHDRTIETRFRMDRNIRLMVFGAVCVPNIGAIIMFWVIFPMLKVQN